MEFAPIKKVDKSGREILLRSATEEDAADLLEYLRATTAETPYLIREPEEVTLTLEQERVLIRQRQESERELMLIAKAGDRLAGCCSVMSIGAYRRYWHRCDVAVALYREFWGRGIGWLLMETVLDVAQIVGYEQAELEVISDNAPAIALYESLGFQRYGTFPQNMKYKDGSYVDAYWMMKQLGK